MGIEHKKIVIVTSGSQCGSETVFKLLNQYYCNNSSSSDLEMVTPTADIKVLNELLLSSEFNGLTIDAVFNKLIESDYQFIIIRRNNLIEQLISYATAEIDSNGQTIPSVEKFTISDAVIFKFIETIFNDETMIKELAKKTDNITYLNYESLSDDIFNKGILPGTHDLIQRIIDGDIKPPPTNISNIGRNTRLKLNYFKHLLNLDKTLSMDEIVSTWKTFCPLLFQHLATHPYGGVTHCCIADHRGSISSAADINGTDKRYYNLYNDSIKNTYNSGSFRQARLDSINSKRIQACLRCYEEEEKDIHSKRLTEMVNFPQTNARSAKQSIDSAGHMDNINFEFIELRLGNVCNVACRTCNPVSSSKWNNEYRKLKNQLSFKLIDYDPSDTYKWPENTSFWDELLPLSRNVKLFYINGGEPTLIKQHFTFLEKLLDTGRSDIKLWYNINATNLNQEIIDIWKKFKDVKISCSIDDIGQRNTYIRWPSDWDTVVHNFLWLKQEGFQVDVTQTVSFMNYSNLDEFYNFFHVKHGAWIHHNYVYQPDYLSPAVLPKAVRDSIHVRFKNTLPAYITENLIKLYSGPDDLDKWNQAREYTTKLDAVRKQNIVDFLPEFKDVFL